MDKEKMKSELETLVKNQVTEALKKGKKIWRKILISVITI